MLIKPVFILKASATGFIHTLATDKHSLYATHLKVGTEARQDIGVLPVYQGTLVHDFWKPYNEFECMDTLCNVHHLRDLTFCHEIEKSRWAGNVKQHLLCLNKKVIIAKDTGASSLSKGQLAYWNKKYVTLRQKGLAMYPVANKEKGKRGVPKKSKTQNMLDRFIHYKAQILAFGKNFPIPFGNNIAEQAIRMMKVKQKISGCFRSEQSARDFADTRSFITTAKKQAIPILQALGLAIQGRPYELEG